MNNSFTKKHNTLFISHTRLHTYLAKKIASEYYSSVDNFICQVGECGRLSERDFKGVLNIGNHKKIFNSRHINASYNKILDYIKKNNISCIFLTYLTCSRNNRLFFSKELQHCNFYIYADGLAIYRPPKVGYELLMKNVVKIFFSYLGIHAKYVSVGNDLFGLSNKNIKGIYAFNSKLISTKKKTYDIPTPKLEINREENRVIFIGQPVWELSGDKRWKKYLESAIAYIEKEYTNSVKYYKTHMRYKDYEINLFSEAGFCIIDDDICFEELVEKMSFTVILSCVSTVLLHSKWIFENVEICSLMTDKIANNTKGMKECLKIFDENNIRIKYLLN